MGRCMDYPELRSSAYFDMAVLKIYTAGIIAGRTNSSENIKQSIQEALELCDKVDEHYANNENKSKG